MTKKHIAIEVMPRALWVVEIAAILLTEKMVGWAAISANHPTLIFFGSILALVGLASLFWTFVFLAKPMFTKELMTKGPYALARHPMYVAIYLTLIGLGLVFGSTAWFIVLLVFVPVWYLDCRLEEGQMTDLWDKDYPAYKQQVGMFFPHSF